MLLKKESHVEYSMGESWIDPYFKPASRQIFRFSKKIQFDFCNN